MAREPICVGVDGCKQGRWVAVWKHPQQADIGVKVFESASAVLARFLPPVVIAVDIPIGLTDAGRRGADVEARRMLKAPRASSVFPAPIRPILNAQSREEASRKHKAIDGRGIGAQSWAILPKIREWDVVLQRTRARILDVFEVHPEVSFWAINGGNALKNSKKRTAGAKERRRILGSEFGESTVDRVLCAEERRGAGRDDLLDALAALWTARRIAQGEARSLPEPPETDSKQLPMAIWY